ncbi:MAG: hypothetical protein LBQ39_07025 [Tannerellaceae bacterium]|nr:hypothetical protein [Tannerellaceae bacterium]
MKKKAELRYWLRIHGFRWEWFSTGTKWNPIRGKRIVRSIALKPVKDHD